MKKLSVAIIAILSLSACATQTEQTLSQKLAGKSKIEKADILYTECLQEAAWRKMGRNSHLNRNAYHARTLKEICNEVAKEMGLDTTSQSQEEKARINSATEIEP